MIMTTNPWVKMSWRWLPQPKENHSFAEIRRFSPAAASHCWQHRLSFCLWNVNLVFFFKWKIKINWLPADTVLTNATSQKSSADDDWWKHAVVYQIYPRSFKDSDGDGTGDIQGYFLLEDFNRIKEFYKIKNSKNSKIPGIIEKLDYLVDIKITAVWISPMYDSPMVDFGYDVRNYREISPIFGTMADFKQLVSEMRKRRSFTDYFFNNYLYFAYFFLLPIFQI